MKKGQMLDTAFDSYSLQEPVGEGGSGVVYRAIDSEGVKVAVKILDPKNATKEKKKRFENEISFCYQVCHQNIIKVLDYGACDTGNGKTLFYVMPFFSDSLRSIMSSQINPFVRLSYFDQLLSGVEAAHLKKVIHRDLKPENVLLDPSKKIAVVADFGIAHFTDEERYTTVITKPGAKLANFQYAAPEQRMRGKIVDHRSDIFSLGLILNELFTNEIPLSVGYKTISSVDSSLEWIDEIVMPMINQDPEKRPESIDAIKRLFIMNKQNYIERQRLSEISKIVIPIGEEDDPLAISPPQIVDFRWGNGMLTLILDKEVNAGWIKGLHNIGSYSSVMGKEPSSFKFSGREAAIAADDSDVQRIIDFFKSWLPRATEVYKRNRQQERMEDKQRFELKMEMEKAEIERRRKLREKIRL